jgi:hypothetical protein
MHRDLSLAKPKLATWHLIAARLATEEALQTSHTTEGPYGQS